MTSFAVGDEVNLEGHQQKYLVVVDLGSQVVVTATEPDTMPMQVFGYPATKVSPYVAPTNTEETGQ